MAEFPSDQLHSDQNSFATDPDFQNIDQTEEGAEGHTPNTLYAGNTINHATTYRVDK